MCRTENTKNTYLTERDQVLHSKWIIINYIYDIRFDYHQVCFLDMALSIRAFMELKRLKYILIYTYKKFVLFGWIAIL